MKECGILIIHGFGGSISEINNFKLFFEHRGYTVSCPTLAGHMMGKKEFRRSNYSQWISSAEDDLLEMKKECKDVFIVGFSMGGLIGINLASKYNLKGIATLNTPIYYWDFKIVVNNVLNDFKNKRFEYMRKYFTATVSTPFNSMINFKRLLNKTKRKLNMVRVPMFIAQGLMDDTTRHCSGEYIQENISSNKSNLRYYENAQHLICNSPDKEVVFNDLISFIEDI